MYAIRSYYASKGTRVDVAERVIRRAAQAGISNLLLMLFGLPGGGEEDLEQTFALLERLRPVADAFSLPPELTEQFSPEMETKSYFIRNNFV